MRSKVLVVGDSMLDCYWHGVVDRLSPEAPVPICHVKKEEFRLGAAANVAHNCSTLGAEVQLVTACGEDDARQTMVAMLGKAGIVPFFHSGGRTTLKLRVIGHQQQIVRCDFEDRCEGVLPVKESIDWADIVIISDYGKGAVQDPQKIIQMGKKVLVDTKTRDYRSFRGAFLLKQNLPEFERAAKGRSPRQVKQDYGIRNLLVTEGSEGMRLYGVHDHKIASVAKEVFDVTGAGDTVMSTLAVFLAEGSELVEACNLANKAAGIVVGKFGTATVTRKELCRN